MRCPIWSIVAIRAALVAVARASQGGSDMDDLMGLAAPPALVAQGAHAVVARAAGAPRLLRPHPSTSTPSAVHPNSSACPTAPPHPFRIVRARARAHAAFASRAACQLSAYSRLASPSTRVRTSAQAWRLSSPVCVTSAAPVHCARTLPVCLPRPRRVR
eukprot:1565374-Pleurochrysis_carterae.AAC.1